MIGQLEEVVTKEMKTKIFKISLIKTRVLQVNQIEKHKD